MLEHRLGFWLGFSVLGRKIVTLDRSSELYDSTRRVSTYSLQKDQRPLSPDDIYPFTLVIA